MKLPDSVNVLLLGSGGREHAFAAKISASDRVSKLYIAPGNAGTASLGTNVDLQPSNFGSIKQFIVTNNINIVVVGPEEPLVKGIADFIQSDSEIYHVPVIGPTAAGARLEGSKDYAKSFMARHNIPTARYRSVTKENLEEGRDFLRTLQPPYVLKADGLAAGKGVLILDNIKSAEVELESILNGRFGAAGNTVIIEEYLDGIECSVFVATDGKNFKVLPVAKDYKRIGDSDTGPNTGGMGAVSPVPFADEAFMARVSQRIIEPTINGLHEDKTDYKGFIFIGLMNVNGDPYVIEYNVRMGDPETEAVLPLIQSDVMGLFEGIAYGKLGDHELRILPGCAVTVVGVAEGYPGNYRKGDAITLPEESDGEEIFIFHAGTAVSQGEIVTSGGRVLAVTALAEDIETARMKAYEVMGKIFWNGKNLRTDVGLDLIKK